MPKPRQVFAFSGLLRLRPSERSRALVDHAVSLAGDGPKQVCFIPTAVGDAREVIESVSALFTNCPDVSFSVLTLFTQPNVPDIRAHLLSQDVLLVGGGSVVNLMAVWRAHQLAPVMRECWHAGVVLAGWSAGSLCWHLGGPTDSFGDSLAPFTDGLGFLPYSNGVHDDLDDQPRRSAYRTYVAQGALTAGYATEDGVACIMSAPTFTRPCPSASTRGRGGWSQPSAVGSVMRPSPPEGSDLSGPRRPRPPARWRWRGYPPDPGPGRPHQRDARNSAIPPGEG